MAHDHALLVGLGQAIRELRSERRMSQEALSLESGVHRNYIGGVERAERRPTIITLDSLARALRLRPSDLLRVAEERAEAAGKEWPTDPLPSNSRQL